MARAGADAKRARGHTARSPGPKTLPVLARYCVLGVLGLGVLLLVVDVLPRAALFTSDPPETKFWEEWEVRCISSFPSHSNLAPPGATSLPQGLPGGKHCEQSPWGPPERK